jgi:putative Holliday junction resolvase
MPNDIIKRQPLHSPKKNEEIVLGIDYGEAKIGIAFGRDNNAMPIDVIRTKDAQTAIKQISDIAIKNHVTKLVVGLPLLEGEKETQQSHKVRAFAKLLKHYIKLPLEFVNEFGTSKDANGYLLSTGVASNKTNLNDDVAAALILKEYFSQKSV